MEPKILVTHDGVFHADDVFAGAVLTTVFSSAELIRTRDKKMIEEAYIAFDVGGEYDSSRRRFDHHQNGGAGTHANEIPYSSFGLIWDAYGRMFIPCCLTEEDFEDNEANLVEFIWRDIDQYIVSPVDAVDNGYSLYRELVNPEVRPFTISGLISLLNPSDEQNPRSFDWAYKVRAIPLALMVLDVAIEESMFKYQSRPRVRQAIKNRAHPQIVVIEHGGAPWQEELFKIDRENQVLFVVFQAPTGNWNCQAAPTVLGSFTQRFPLPANWAGKTDEELAQISGVPDAVFCHRERFLSGAKSKEGALAMAMKSLPGGQNGK